MAFHRDGRYKWTKAGPSLLLNTRVSLHICMRKVVKAAGVIIIPLQYKCQQILI